ncbi:type VI secretion system baseplate subunit TssF [Oceanobacter mangrovi]|uniref:type VI secretion system baseplate subunit TssF n=1 Tax=Oceanobacter mangrovi TaxID=2862510 RepID=UPI001C8D5EC7|nr:type VI secretion system baseplate subunit TssF [Oceanobacter mangrovi]
MSIQHFQQELSALRRSVDAFTQAYPSAAAELRLSAGHSADPHVEQLLQSFAWMTGRLRADMESQRNEIPNHLLLSLYPALIRSIPSMTVMQANVQVDGVNFVNGYQLNKGRIFSARSNARPDSNQKTVECRMQCSYNTPLWPFELDDVGFKPRNSFDFLDQRSDVQSVISITMHSDGSDPVYEYPVERLRFFIADADIRPALYQLLSDQVRGIALRVDDQIIELPASTIQWCGFRADENVLPQSSGEHDAYRLLQEYFHFPEKFYFFEITGLDLKQVSTHFELLILLDQTSALPALSRQSLVFNAFPAINLFPTTFSPVQLDYSQYEYRLLADQNQYGQSEVYAVEQVDLLSADGQIKQAAPWLGHYDLKHTGTLASSRFLTRLVPPLSAATRGCDTMIALYDEGMNADTPIDQTLSARGQCCNRSLPESLRIGNRMKLVGAGALSHANIVCRPTLFRDARLNGQAVVALLEQLHLNLLSLAEEGQSGNVIRRFKRLIALYSDALNPSHSRQIQGIVSLSARRSVRRMGADAWRGHYQGTLISLTVDENYFNGANALLLGEVLSHFLGLYTTLNHFVQLQLFSYQREGVWKQWHPRIGEQVIL